MNWRGILKKIAPNGKSEIINGLAGAMPDVIRIANLTTPNRLAHFFAQLAHESDGFRTTVEYASGRAYNGRKDLGNRPGTNDGVTYKGRGLIQLTGRANYAEMSKKLGVDLIKDPTLAAKFPYAALTAAYFWASRNLNVPADLNDVKAVTKRINGGYNGLSDRIKYLRIAQEELSDVRMAQRRLVDLKYSLGGIDGIIGPLTRSAIRDFQDAAKLPVTGALDDATKKALFAPNAPERPVSKERASLDADDLIKKGSVVVEGTQQARKGIIGAGLATAATAASEVREMSGQVTEISEGLKHGASMAELMRDYWYVFAIFILCAVICFLLWRAYQGATKAQASRINTARDGTNVRI